MAAFASELFESPQAGAQPITQSSPVIQRKKVQKKEPPFDGVKIANEPRRYRPDETKQHRLAQ
jgi:hypothetical protein